jgi:hypothetical protein
MRVRSLGVGCWLVFGCGAPGEVREPAGDSTVAAPPVAAPPDTMVLQSGRYRIWLTEGRVASDSTGRTCFERSVEVRTDSSRTKVPLLYVLEMPTHLDRAHVRAILSYRCAPLAAYRVELATGRPFKLGAR